MAIPKDDLIEALAPDPNNIEPLQMLYGWLGKSNRKGYVRLYDNLDLQVYVEFSKKDVVLTKSMKTASTPLGGTLVWLPRDAKVITTGQNEAQVTERSFLSGELAAEVDAAERNMVIIEDDIMLMACGKTRRRKVCLRKTIWKPPSLHWNTCRAGCAF